jgi:hypothetical protein
MIGRGGGGWILSGIRVEEGGIDVDMRKKRKVAGNGTKTDNVAADIAPQTDN